MKTVNWELFNAKQTDKYGLVNEDGTESLIDGVVTFAALKAVVSDGDNVFNKMYHVALRPPVKEDFTPVEDLTREQVLEWALESLGSNKKESIEKSILSRLGKGEPVHKTIFQSLS